MWEDFLNALNNFKRNKTRTVLSLLGVIIGVASVIIITSLGSSSTKEVEDSFGSQGLDIVNISSGGMMRRGRSAASIRFNDSFRDDLYDNVENIKKVWYKSSLSATMTYDDNSSSINCSAIETGYLEIYNIEMEEGGRFFNATDNYEGTQKIILSHSTAEDFFEEENPLGKKVLIVVNRVSFNFEVIGVLKDQSTGMENSAAYIPRGFYNRKIQPNAEASGCMVQAVSEDKALGLVDDIKEYCTSLTGSENSVNVSSMQSMIDQISSITDTIASLLSAIAAISLLVGGIGIMNIMIVTVTERRQEIGIRKALGATPGNIKQQFLVESASITLLGGFFGILIGVLISLLVEGIKKQAFIININACIIAFVFSVFVGIFFGLNPASRAAKLDPVIALSGE